MGEFRDELVVRLWLMELKNCQLHFIYDWGLCLGDEGWEWGGEGEGGGGVGILQIKQQSVIIPLYSVCYRIMCVCVAVLFVKNKV